MDNTIEEIKSNLLPDKSAEKYKKSYKDFKDWMRSQGRDEISEDNLLLYFSQVQKGKAPNSLWPKYSMLKRTLKKFDGIDIYGFHQLIYYIKKQNVGYKPKKPPTFSSEEVNQFLSTAPDHLYLLHKVQILNSSLS